MACLSGILRVIGCIPAVSYYNIWFIFSHKAVTTIYFPPLLVLCWQLRMSLHLLWVMIDPKLFRMGLQILHAPWTAWGKVRLLHWVISLLKNLWCWGETNWRLISNHTDCTLFGAQHNGFFLQLFTNANKMPYFQWKSQKAWVYQ